MNWSDLKYSMTKWLLDLLCLLHCTFILSMNDISIYFFSTREIVFLVIFLSCSLVCSLFLFTTFLRFWFSPCFKFLFVSILFSKVFLVIFELLLFLELVLKVKEKTILFSHFLLFRKKLISFEYSSFLSFCSFSLFFKLFTLNSTVWVVLFP